MFCDNCGKPIEEGSKHCDSCGVSIVEHETDEKKKDSRQDSSAKSVRKFSKQTLWISVAAVTIIALVVIISIRFFMRPASDSAFQSTTENAASSTSLATIPSDNATTTTEIQALQEEVTKLQNQKPTVIVDNQGDNSTISAADLNPYLTGVIRIACTNSDDEEDGSGSLWNLPNLGYAVLTNEHVIDDENSGGINEGVDGGVGSAGNELPNIPNACASDIGQSTIPTYYVDLGSAYHWNQEADAAALSIYQNQGWYNKLSSVPDLLSEFPLVDDLNYSISKLRLCPGNIAVGSSVSIIGFPAFGYTTDQYGETPHQIITTGIISSAFTHDLTTDVALTYPDFFTSAKMDSGDSGGIAFSKDANGLCVLGIPTWINSGNYESEGVIQNIRNIFKQGQ